MQIEDWYKTEDPWGYKTNPDDIERKARILNAIPKRFRKYKKALDIGAGEGWITQDLPAKEIYGYELSDTASLRFPDNVQRVQTLEGEYDLIIATGVLYAHYNAKEFLDAIRRCATGIVVTSNIKSWEVNDLPKDKLIAESEFKYRDYIQHLCTYDFSTS